MSKQEFMTKLAEAGIKVTDGKIAKADIEKAINALGSIAKRNIKVSLIYSYDLYTDEKHSKIYKYLKDHKAYPRASIGNGIYEIGFSCKEYSDAEKMEKEIEKIFTK